MSDKPEALFLADELEAPIGTVISYQVDCRAAVELRRQHAEIEALKAERDALRTALESLLVYEPEHCACGEPICNEPQQAWQKARAALKAREVKP